MTRNLKALVLTLLVAFAMTAMAASAAQANTMFTAESYPATTMTHSEESEIKVSVNSLTINCTTHYTHDEVQKTGEEPEKETVAKNCTAFGLEAIMNPRGCGRNYSLLNGGPPYRASTSIKCEEKKEGEGIEISTVGCTVIIPPQKGLEEVTFANIGEGSKRQVEMNMNISGMAYSKSGLCGSETASNGTMTGSDVISGYNEAAEQQGLFISK